MLRRKIALFTEFSIPYCNSDTTYKLFNLILKMYNSRRFIYDALKIHYRPPIKFIDNIVNDRYF